MIVKNPTDSEITVSINGNSYTVSANGSTKNVPEVDARYWKKSLHQFLILEEESKVAPKVEVEKIISEAKKVIKK